MIAFLGTLVGWIVAGFQASIDFIVVALEFAYHVLRVAAGAVWDAVKFSWSNILKPLGQWLDRVYQRVKAFYDKVFAPIEKWLRRITDITRKIYNLFVRPILDVIDGVRRALKLLELLHIEWAKKLDDELAALETKIALPVQEVIQFVNAIDSRISAYILTVDNLFRQATMLGSLRRDLNPLLNMQLNRMITNIPHELAVGPDGASYLGKVEMDTSVFTQVVEGRDADRGVNVSTAEQVFVDLVTEP